jgi:hypothetical protein
MTHLCALALGTVTLMGGVGAVESASDAPKSPATQPQSFDQRLLEIAREYGSYGRFDDEARWAPIDCRDPMPSRARFSRSDDGDTHGQKIYFLFARDRQAYLKAAESKADQPAGQALVKESWAPQEVPARTEQKRIATENSAMGPGSAVPFAKKDDKLYHADHRSSLFIMFKLDPQTPKTDGGWVYGTVSADGKTVTTSGMVESCMKCHKEATSDRVFGVEYHGM